VALKKATLWLLPPVTPSFLVAGIPHYALNVGGISQSVALHVTTLSVDIVTLRFFFIEKIPEQPVK